MPVSERAWRLRALADKLMVEKWAREAKVAAEARRPKTVAEQIWPHLRAETKPNAKEKR